MSFSCALELLQMIHSGNLLKERKKETRKKKESASFPPLFFFSWIDDLKKNAVDELVRVVKPLFKPENLAIRESEIETLRKIGIRIFGAIAISPQFKSDEMLHLLEK